MPANLVPPPPKIIPRLANLTEKERAVESRFAEAYLADPDGMVEKYRAGRNNVVGHNKDGSPIYEIGDAPNIFGTDDVKMLSDDFNPKGADPETVKFNRGAYNAPLHQTANALAKRSFLHHLDTVVAGLPKEQRFVLVTSGGCAAGKGYALKNIPDTSGLMSKAGAVWDAAGEQNATENGWVLDECKKRGLKCIFAFIHADPANSWASPTQGVVERANKKGRMVDAKLFADSYEYGAKNFHQFMQNNQHDDHADFLIINNGTGGDPIKEQAMPPAALQVKSDHIYAQAVDVIKKRAGSLSPGVVYGGLIGGRIWGEPEGVTEPAPPAGPGKKPTPAVPVPAKAPAVAPAPAPAPAPVKKVATAEVTT